jgi:tricorn protease-like protein
VVFDSSREGAVHVRRIPAVGGQAERITTGEGASPRWSPDGTQVYFIGNGQRANNVWSVPAGGGKERPVTEFSGRRGALARLALAVDARHLYIGWEERRSNLWIADLVQPTR